MEHILLTAFLCFVAFVALGQAAYACPRQHSAEKLYAPPARSVRADAARDRRGTDEVTLTLVSGGLDAKIKVAKEEDVEEITRKAA